MLVTHIIILLINFTKTTLTKNKRNLNFLKEKILKASVLVSCNEYCNEPSFMSPEFIIFLSEILGALKDMKPT